MPNYLLAYHGGSNMADATPDQQNEVMQAWITWFGNLGGAIVDTGNPVATAKTIASNGNVNDGGGANALSGYSVIKADDIDAAVALAQGCPHLKGGGTVEVAETFNVGP